MLRMVDALAERLNRPQRLMSAGALPVLSQFPLVFTAPFGHEPQRTRRQSPGDDGHRLDVDRGLVLRVARVKVRTSEMVDLVVIEPNRDPVEGADPRHAPMMSRSPVASPNRSFRHSGSGD